jgi:RimJ/RimL family protein N-acetyltransferase
MFAELRAGAWTLRPLRIEDAGPWLEVVNEAELRRLTSWNVDTLADMERNVQSYLSGPKALTTRRWAIVDGDGVFCGTCGFKDWDREARTAELAYELAAARRGAGVMTAVANAALEHARTEMKLRTVTALVNLENAPSIRLLEKLGFVRTETLPAFRACGGVLRDFGRYVRSL